MLEPGSFTSLVGATTGPLFFPNKHGLWAGFLPTSLLRGRGGGRWGRYFSAFWRQFFRSLWATVKAQVCLLRLRHFTSLASLHKLARSFGHDELFFWRGVVISQEVEDSVSEEEADFVF